MKVPPTSTPRSIGRSLCERRAASRAAEVAAALARSGGRQLAILGVGQVLVGGAVAVVRQRRALAAAPLRVVARHCGGAPLTAV